MGEKTNFVIAFERATLEQEARDWSHLTAQFALHVLGAPARRWMAIRNSSQRRGAWPLSSKEIAESIAHGEVIAVYPRADDSSVDGAIVWSLGRRVGTATVAVPADRLSEADRRVLAVASMQLAGEFGAILCAVGSELELHNENTLIVDRIAKRPDVYFVAFPNEHGVQVLGRAAPHIH